METRRKPTLWLVRYAQAAVAAAGLEDRLQVAVWHGKPHPDHPALGLVYDFMDPQSPLYAMAPVTISDAWAWFDCQSYAEIDSAVNHWKSP